MQHSRNKHFIRANSINFSSVNLDSKDSSGQLSNNSHTLVPVQSQTHSSSLLLEQPPAING